MAETLHPHGLWNAYESAAPGYPVTIAYMDGAKEVTICDVTEQGERYAQLIAEAPAMTEAAKVVCRAAMESKGPASEALQREAAYLRLNADEQLYLLSLCILYAQGRIDQIRSQR